MNKENLKENLIDIKERYKTRQTLKFKGQRSIVSSDLKYQIVECIKGPKIHLIKSYRYLVFLSIIYFVPAIIKGSTEKRYAYSFVPLFATVIPILVAVIPIILVYIHELFKLFL